jgi:hypothetical protein
MNFFCVVYLSETLLSITARSKSRLSLFLSKTRIRLPRFMSSTLWWAHSSSTSSPRGHYLTLLGVWFWSHHSTCNPRHYVHKIYVQMYTYNEHGIILVAIFVICWSKFYKVKANLWRVEQGWSLEAWADVVKITHGII